MNRTTKPDEQQLPPPVEHVIHAWAGYGLVPFVCGHVVPGFGADHKKKNAERFPVHKIAGRRAAPSGALILAAFFNGKRPFASPMTSNLWLRSRRRRAFRPVVPCGVLSLIVTAPQVHTHGRPGMIEARSERSERGAFPS